MRWTWVSTQMASRPKARFTQGWLSCAPRRAEGQQSVSGAGYLVLLGKKAGDGTKLRGLGTVETSGKDKLLDGFGAQGPHRGQVGSHGKQASAGRERDCVSGAQQRIWARRNLPGGRTAVGQNVERRRGLGRGLRPKDRRRLLPSLYSSSSSSSSGSGSMSSSSASGSAPTAILPRGSSRS